MLTTPHLVNVIASIFIATAFAATPASFMAGTTAPTVNIDMLVATTTPVIASSTPKVKTTVKKKPAVKARSGDCKQFESLIGKYDWPVAVAMEVCKNESHGDPANVGDIKTAHVSCGLMQIRTLKGRPTCTELKDPETNIAFAYELWTREGFRPWSVCINIVDCD